MIDRCTSRLCNFPINRQALCCIQDSLSPCLNISLIIYIASVSPDTVFACRGCVNSLLTRILQYTGFTFDTLENCASIYTTGTTRPNTCSTVRDNYISLSLGDIPQILFSAYPSATPRATTI
jgi:hypothetical protein